mmetsp:Transcript_27223/g.69156  ORF Transcript_27223/g.69156 Transcript_27223/m.69156 type:complete len:212 (-) Transcript_27223:517-1152(-)
MRKLVCYTCITLLHTTDAFPAAVPDLEHLRAVSEHNFELLRDKGFEQVRDKTSQPRAHFQEKRIDSDVDLEQPKIEELPSGINNLEKHLLPLRAETEQLAETAQQLVEELLRADHEQNRAPEPHNSEPDIGASSDVRVRGADPSINRLLLENEGSQAMPTPSTVVAQETTSTSGPEDVDEAALREVAEHLRSIINELTKMKMRARTSRPLA